MLRTQARYGLIFIFYFLDSHEINVSFVFFVAANQKETGGRSQAPGIPVRQAERAVGEDSHTAHVLQRRR